MIEKCALDIAIPLSGRGDVVDGVMETISEVQHGGHVRVTVLDGGISNDDGRRISEFLSDAKLDFQWSCRKPPFGDDWNYTEPVVRRDSVQPLEWRHLRCQRVAWVWEQLHSLIQNPELVLALEEDVVPITDGWYKKLVRELGTAWGIGAIGAAVPLRMGGSFGQPIVWEKIGTLFGKESWSKTGVERVCGTGFGCTLFRPHAWLGAFRYWLPGAETACAQDSVLSADLKRKNVPWMVHWDVRCRHDGIEPGG